MFSRARLRLTLFYVLLLSGTLALVAGAIFFFSVRQARLSEDQELKLRADGLTASVLRAVSFDPAAVGRIRPSDYSDTGLPPEREGSGGAGGRAPGPPRPRGLEQEGTLTYILAVFGGQLGPAPSSSVTGLPDAQAAAAALAAGKGTYHTVALDGGDVRVYSAPVVSGGRTVAVVQVARSQYFVQSTVTRLLMTVLAAGAVGLVASAVAGYWLAGRTLRPIAAALQRQRDFTADASHELRTPLTIVRGNAELLLRHPDRSVGAYQDVVQDIVAESDRLGRLVADLLTLARADDDRVQLAQAPVDFSALALAAVRDFRPLAEAKGLALRAEIAPDVTVTGDADRLRQLAGILLDNAIRYTAGGEVRLILSPQGHGAQLAVADTGPGIDAEHRARIFERFYRVDAARSSSEDGGTGLGLAIARWIAEAHGGRIEVESTPGQGSTFAVTLPSRAAAPAPATRTEVLTPPPTL